MPQPDTENADRPVVLLTGASGYVGGRLLPLLERQPVAVRCLARNPDKLRPLAGTSTQVVRGDVLDAASLAEALNGVHIAYYLVHPKAKGRLPQVKAFVSWIEAQAKAHEDALLAIDNGAGI